MAYVKTIWENLPSETTPINASNLNKIENGIYDNSVNIGELENLETGNKSSLVNAINEVNAKTGRTTLWSGTQSSGSVSFNESIQNYDFILIGIQASGYSKSSMLIPVSDIVVESGISDTYEIAVMQSSSVYVSMQLKFITNTTLEIMSTHEATWADPRLKYVIGIKL